MEGGFRPGTVLLDKYRVESTLGRGGMAIVLKATHLHLGEEVALKILQRDAADQVDHARFLREAQSAVRLRGEHVARVLDVGRLPDATPYIVMEYLRGADLSSEIKRRGTLPPGETVDYVLQACEALAEAHAHGVIHRDIKPSNLFLTVRPDGTPLLKVLDFGISKAPASGNSLTQTGSVMGTAGYMSPEQMKAARDVDARTDIWALGVVLYECLAGRPPFYAEAFSAMVLMAANDAPPPMDPQLPRGLEDIVMCCLAKNREERFTTVAALAGALASYARDQRGAALVLERARTMLGGVVAEPPPPPVGGPEAMTTLQGTAGVRISAKRLRYTMAGAVTIAGVIGGVLAIAFGGARNSDGTAGGSGGVPPPPPVATGSASPAAAAAASGGVAPSGAAPAVAPSVGTVPGAAPAGAAQSGAALPGAVPAVVSPPGAALAAVPAGDGAPTTATAATPAAMAAALPPGVDPRIADKFDLCVSYEKNRAWGALKGCAADLAALAATDPAIRGRADQIRARADKESGYAVSADRMQLAIDDRRLLDAQKFLKAIPAESVYWTRSSDRFRAAETAAVDENRRKAQSLADARDCSGLRALARQLATTGTPSVTEAVAAVRCSDRSERTTAAPTAAAHKPDADDARAKDPCDQLIAQAQAQDDAGAHREALALIQRALTCRPEPSVYRTAAMYACGAGDLAAVRRYYSHLPPGDQSAVEQRCDADGHKFVP
jgi:serine/threonine-protein kinase